MRGIGSVGMGDGRNGVADQHMHHHHSGLGGVGRGGKGCATFQCSWRLLAIALLLTCGLLAAALAYFTGTF
jgi:hypothetical protein